MKKESKLYKWGKIILLYIVVMIFALLFKHNVMALAFIKSTSMYPTLNDCEFVLLSRTNKTDKSKYQVGDIVMFEAPSVTKTIEEMFFEGPFAVYNDEPEGTLNRIIYYVFETTKTSYVKRIIAFGGDTVEFKNNKVYVNDVELEEDYLPEGTITESQGIPFIRVPEGYVYVLGDNREESLDSRRLGCIPIERLEGKVLFK